MDGDCTSTTQEPVVEDEIPKVSSTEETQVDKIEGESSHDPYAYLNRREFTSENFKIELKNLPKYFGVTQLKKFLKKMEVDAHKIKTVDRYAFVGFCSNAEREDAIRKLKGAIFKGQVLDAVIAKPMQDPLIKKRKTDAENQDQIEKRAKSNESVEDQISRATVSLAQVPYQQQLELKEKEMRKILVQMTQEIKKAHPKISPFIDQQIAANDGLICPFTGVVGSPVTSNYRNKCDFTVGLNPETNELTVGFRLSSYKRGSFSVGPIDHLPHIPIALKKAVRNFQAHFRNSGKTAFNPEDKSGFWRQVTMRTSLTGDVMATVVVHPQEYTNEEMDHVKEELKSLAQVGKICSLYFQSYSVKKSEEPPVEHLFGATHLREQLCGLEFSISPQAFFQINTLAAEVLYNKVAELAELNTETSVLDVCCGTGTIGLSLAKKCQRVLGVELIPDAVEDAKKNASRNGITNSYFVAGRAEEVLNILISKIHPDSKAVAVLDPPRAGLHQRCCQLLRKTERIDRMVYVSCDASAAMKSFIDLCRATSNGYGGRPFLPTKALAVDLFPDTPHCELVIVLERYVEDKSDL